MTIQYAILGLLSWRPLSGYDLKKLFAGSDVFYWSGNNNQIYRTLVQLHKDGLVTQEIQQQESAPARKIYTITEQGRAALKQWLLSAPELPEFRSHFLVRLAWAGLLAPDELDALLAAYEEELHMELLMREESARRGNLAPNRNPRETYLWEMIARRAASVYEHELHWVQEVRAGLKQFVEEST